MPGQDSNSWLAWQKAVLSKLDDLDQGQREMREEMQKLRDLQIETVGVSGKNGRLGMLTERVTNLESDIKKAHNVNRTRLFAGGALGGGGLAAIVEFIKNLV